ncbi:hypothetical protein SLEP1_g31565 [Rubroshorea leprosula]|uniref:Uncharacterized protein n=1 Tax=Rubroshorea leprosula TaxID=152421 RepID=A0AAV5KB51_9ROSI|nr:hypothetical protein SLEP1_g31565 [Rubroshorea leprosula]
MQLLGSVETQPCWIRRAAKAGFIGTQQIWVSTNPARLGSVKPSWASFQSNPAGLGSNRTQQGWVSTKPSFAGKAGFAISMKPSNSSSPRKEKKKKRVKIGFVDGVEMRKHSQKKKKKWVKINFANGVEMREHSKNKKKWVKIDFVESEDERPVCRQRAIHWRGFGMKKMTCHKKKVQIIFLSCARYLAVQENRMCSKLTKLALRFAAGSTKKAECAESRKADCINGVIYREDS